MRLFTRTISIARPPEAVFDFFVDFTRASEWRQYVSQMSLAGDGPVRAGSLVHVVMDIAGEPYAFDLEVEAVVRPSTWRHRTNEPDYTGHVEYRFDREADGTRVTMQFDITPIGWWGWLGVPVLLLRRRVAYKEQLPGLKAALEQPR